MLPPHAKNAFEQMKKTATAAEKSCDIDELTWARLTVCRWRANAQIHGRHQAEADCTRLLNFINSLVVNIGE